jgi:hypothetical protein
MAAVDMFADLGVDLYHQGALTDGLELLAARLDYAGMGDLVAELLATDWSPDKQTPNPTPKPPPPPPPKPPKGRRS